jgi:two-component system KDP operon response regulator KdpE
VDDYFVLPITQRELVARVRALSRRWQTSRNEQPTLVFDELVLSPDKQTVDLEGRTIDLTPMEFRLLACLVSAQGHVLTHDYIMANVWGAEYVESRHYLHLYIRYLRDKLEADPKDPRLIISEWGVGYRLQCTAEAGSS